MIPKNVATAHLTNYWYLYYDENIYTVVRAKAKCSKNHRCVSL